MNDPIIKYSPQEPELEGGGYSWWWVCPECHGYLKEGVSPCPHCQTPLIWKTYYRKRGE